MLSVQQVRDILATISRRKWARERKRLLRSMMTLEARREEWRREQASARAKRSA